MVNLQAVSIVSAPGSYMRLNLSRILRDQTTHRSQNRPASRRLSTHFLLDLSLSSLFMSASDEAPMSSSISTKHNSFMRLSSSTPIKRVY